MGGLFSFFVGRVVIFFFSRWSEFQEVSWWGVEDGGLVCVEKESESKGGRGGGRE